MQASSAISFRLPPASISAAASSGSPFSAFRLLWGRCFHGLTPFPHHFLPPLFFVRFRVLQFWVLTTQPLFLPFPPLPGSASQLLPQCSGPLSASCLSPSVRLISHSSFRFSVLGLLFVSFRPTLLRSHSCSAGDCLVLSLSALAASLSLSFVRFRSAS